jgi:CO/xanthine dehydrogenase Mo-binding subunit
MKRYGKGFATIIYPIGATAYSNPSIIVVKVTEEGRAIILTGTSEIGQGSDTALSQIAADSLGFPFSQVQLISGNTYTSPYDHGAGASRQTYIAGNAVKEACSKVRDILLQGAAKLTGCSPGTLEISDGFVISQDNSKPLMTVAELAKVIYGEEISPLPIAEGRFDPDVTELAPETGQGRPFSVYAFATQVAEVKVDDETGEVEIIHISAAHDVGIPINPMLLEGQVIGGISMGIGYALYEKIIIDEQGVRNPNFVDYILPTAADMPEVDVVFLDETAGGETRFSKGIGEPSVVPTAPAIANAIFQAVGVRMYELPMTPESILKAINDKKIKKEVNL